MTERAAPKVLCAGIAVQDIVMRVESFPAPGTKVRGSDFIITGGGCAANAAGAVVRLGGRAGFAGPLGGTDDAVSNRIVEDLAAEGIDCAGVVRTAGATASVSLILIDAAGEKSIATRRGAGLSQALPRDAAALVADADALLVDNRFPEFVTVMCQAAKARGLPIVIDLDQATRPDDALLKLGSHVIASAEALRGSTGEKDFGKALALLAEHLSRLPGGDRRRARRLLARGRARCGTCRASRCRWSTRSARATSSTPASRCGWPRPATWSRRCASAAPPPRSNAPASAERPARRAEPRWSGSCKAKADACRHLASGRG